ncbi:MAG: hypothetical protein AAF443_01850 [Chlamydiota bacterium]
MISTNIFGESPETHSFFTTLEDGLESFDRGSIHENMQRIKTFNTTIKDIKGLKEAYFLTSSDPRKQSLQNVSEYLELAKKTQELVNKNIFTPIEALKSKNKTKLLNQFKGKISLIHQSQEELQEIITRYEKFMIVNAFSRSHEEFEKNPERKLLFENFETSFNAFGTQVEISKALGRSKNNYTDPFQKLQLQQGNPETYKDRYAEFQTEYLKTLYKLVESDKKILELAEKVLADHSALTTCPKSIKFEQDFAKDFENNPYLEELQEAVQEDKNSLDLSVLHIIPQKAKENITKNEQLIRTLNSNLDAGSTNGTPK